jgi:hypothetical protein
MDSMGYTLNKFIHSVYALQYHLEEATLDQLKKYVENQGEKCR